MLFVFLCCLFVFLGMFIARRFNLKYISISFMFGLFLINCLIQILPSSYNTLNINYHSTTFIYVFLGIVIGVVSMMLFDYKSDNCDDISIIGFSLINTYILCSNLSKINLIIFIVNAIYYFSIGVYIKDGKSWISVFIGMILGIIISTIESWVIGYIFAIIFGIIVCFVYSISIVVMNRRCKYSNLFLIFGMLVAWLGCVL